MPSATYSSITANVEFFWHHLVKGVDKGIAIVGGIVSHKTVEFLDKIILADNVVDNLGLRSACMVTEKRPKGNKEVALVIESVWQRCQR